VKRERERSRGSDAMGHVPRNAHDFQKLQRAGKQIFLLSLQKENQSYHYVDFIPLRSKFYLKHYKIINLSFLKVYICNLL
jgi:hypothetical protein